MSNQYSVTNPVERPLHPVKFLMITLMDDPFLVELSKIYELSRVQTITRIPNTPSYEKGLANLRGQLIPVIDLRERLGLEKFDYHPQLPVIVFKIWKDNRHLTVAGVVDSTGSVVDVNPDQLQAKSTVTKAATNQFCQSVANVSTTSINVLDIDCVFA